MKYKIKRFSVFMLLIVVALFSFGGCKTFARTEWQQVYDAYTNEKDRFVYHSLNATIIDFNEFTANRVSYFKLAIDEEDFLERYKDDSKVGPTLGTYKTLSFYFVEKSIEYLEQAGFFIDISENTVISFIVNDYIGWDGWQCPIFGVKVNDKIYLDFETGYKNVIDYVQTKIESLT